MTIRTALSQLVTLISNCNLSGDGCLTTSCLVLISMSFHSRFTFFKKLIPNPSSAFPVGNQSLFYIC